MAVPKAYEEININIPMVKLISFMSKTGLTRWLPGIAESDAIKHGTLSKDEKELYKAIFNRRTLTKTMIKEMQEIKMSALKVGQIQVTNLPILMFTSNGQGTGLGEKKWTGFQKNIRRDGKIHRKSVLD